MARLSETFRARQGGIKVGDIVIAIIVCLSLLSIGSGTFAAVEGTEKEKDRKSVVCLKEFKDNECNIYSPSEICKPIIQCIRERNEPMLD